MDRTGSDISAGGDRPRETSLRPLAAPAVRAAMDARLRAATADLQMSEGSPWPSGVPCVRGTLGANQAGGNRDYKALISSPLRLFPGRSRPGPGPVGRVGPETPCDPLLGDNDGAAACAMATEISVSYDDDTTCHHQCAE